MQNQNAPTPIAVLVIGYIREYQITQCIQQVSTLNPYRIYLAFDGPKTEEDQMKINKARSAALKEVKWKCEIYTYFSNKNLGCKKFPISAISWFFKSEPEGIILEDDILIHPYFVEFIRRCNHYASINSIEYIGLISACSYPSLLSRRSGSLENNFITMIESKIPNIWGWYSKRSIWDEFHIFNTTSSISSISTFKSLAKSISIKQAILFTLCIRLAKLNLLDAWDYLFLEFLITKGYKTIIPSVSLSSNIGFDKDATHTANEMSPTSSLPSDLFISNTQRLIEDKKYDCKISLNAPWQKAYNIHAAKGVLRIVFDKVLYYVKNLYKFYS